MKTWLITGCSSGIGRGIAKAVLKKGIMLLLLLVIQVKLPI